MKGYSPCGQLTGEPAKQKEEDKDQDRAAGKKIHCIGYSMLITITVSIGLFFCVELFLIVDVGVKYLIGIHGDWYLQIKTGRPAPPLVNPVIMKNGSPWQAEDLFK